jgi:hypothetical protein
VNIAKPAQLNAGVDLGRGDRRVAQHFLHSAQMGASGEQVGSEAVSQSVWADVAGQSSGLSVTFDDPPEGDPR